MSCGKSHSITHVYYSRCEKPNGEGNWRYRSTMHPPFTRRASRQDSGPADPHFARNSQSFLEINTVIAFSGMRLFVCQLHSAESPKYKPLHSCQHALWFSVNRFALCCRLCTTDCVLPSVYRTVCRRLSSDREYFLDLANFFCLAFEQFGHIFAFEII